MPTLQGWKTLLVFLGVTIVGGLQAFNWASIFPNNPQVVGIIVAVIGVVGMGLRAITSTPIGSSTTK
jgi:hypothetical protein